jgi:hypothetical protein
MNIYSDGLHAKRRVRNYSFFDHVVTTDGLGSARYCREWMDVYRGLVPESDLPRTEGIRVAWAKNTAEGYSNDKAIGSLLDTLPYDVPECVFVYVPPRRIPVTTRPSGWFITRGPDGCSTHVTSQVVDWADVMLTTTSCTTAEYFIKNKPVISMPWLHRRRVSFDDYRACDRTLNYKDLVSKLRGGVFASNDADRWISDYVYAGKDNDYDVLGAYVKFIVEKA